MKTQIVEAYFPAFRSLFPGPGHGVRVLSDKTHDSKQVVVKSEGKGEDGLFFRNGMRGDGSVVQPQYLPREAKPDTRTALFCSEERDEYLIKDLGKDARTVIGDLHGDTSPLIIICFQLYDRFFMFIKGMD